MNLTPHRILLTALLCCGQVSLAQDTAQREVKITGDRLGGFVLPILPVESDIRLEAIQTHTWHVDDTSRMQLIGDVQVTVGGFAFTAAEAIVWIDRIPSAGGLVNQLAVYFPEVEEPTRRAGLGVAGTDVLVVGTARGKVQLATSVHTTGPPSDDRVLRRGEQRLAIYLRQLAQGLASTTDADRPHLFTRPEALTKRELVLPIPVPGGSPRMSNETARAIALLPETITLPSRNDDGHGIFQPKGLISFSADSIEIDEATDSIVTNGHFLLDYDPLGSDDAFSPLQLSAAGGVVFLKPGTLASLQTGNRRFDVEQVDGIYLEGDVWASDGSYTIRSGSIYYDVQTNRALMVDTLLRTNARLRGDRPVYARAKEMRQLSGDQWDARQAIVSTSAFFTPQLSIGLNHVTIQRRPMESSDNESANAAQPQMRTWITGEDLTLRAGGVPFFYLPAFSAEADAIPFRSMNLGYDQEFGAEIETTWDLFSALGMRPPEDVDGALQVDGFSKRGVALGVDLQRETEDSSTMFSAYGLYDTGGVDRTSAGESKTIDAGMRGEIIGAMRIALSSDLTFQGNLNWMSDPTFASAWRRDAFNTRLDFSSNARLDRRHDNTQLSLGVKRTMIDFVVSNQQMASRPYMVDKMPELAYRRYGDSFFDDALSWTSEYSATAMRMRITSGTPESLGVPAAAFATNSQNQSIQQLYESAGYNDQEVTRLDTRHELSLPMNWGPTNVVPYVMGRFTNYMSNDFTAYNPDAKSTRLFGALGLKASTTFVEVHNSFQNELLDLDRLRHVVRPYVHAWVGHDTINEEGLPVYDQEVEGMRAGSAVRFGVRQILQTKRGGAGQRRSVDWIDLDVGAVLNDGSDVYTLANARTPWHNAQGPSPTFIDWRPELSQWGSHVYGRLKWALSDTFSIGGSTIVLVDNVRGVALLDNGTLVEETYSGLMRGSIGFQIQHSPAMSTYLEYRMLSAGNTELLQGGIAYQVGRRYVVGVTPQYDLHKNEIRAINSTLTRSFTDFELALVAGYDVIRDSPSVSVRFALPPGSGR